MSNLRDDDTAHDVLAADEFAVPARDEFRHQGPVRLPDDPTGVTQPHDVLAAEDFAMPAPSAAPYGKLSRNADDLRQYLRIAAVLAAVVLLIRARRRG